MLNNTDYFYLTIDDSAEYFPRANTPNASTRSPAQVLPKAKRFYVGTLLFIFAKFVMTFA
jgi:hypothetical protein